MKIEFLIEYERFDAIINLYNLEVRDDLSINYSNKDIALHCSEAATAIFSILSFCGLRNGVDYLVHGSIMDFDGINEW